MAAPPLEGELVFVQPGIHAAAEPVYLPRVDQVAAQSHGNATAATRCGTAHLRPELIWTGRLATNGGTFLSNGKNLSNKPSDFSRAYNGSGLSWTAVKPPGFHQTHQTLHSFFSSGTECRHDLLVAQSRMESLLRELNMSGVDADTRKHAARS